MDLPAGTRLGSYEITSLLARGGMGEVYRALDSKLKRYVAIKILPEEFSRDPERIQRFQREAEVLASLNHRNIAAIYDLQQSDAARYLVLELVEGDTLSDIINKRGALPIPEALRIAKQICAGLEAAHEKGIVHRDLKPANIKVQPGGDVRILDFGLAKILQHNRPSVEDDSPTAITEETRGMVVGTAAYMSPELAKGGEVGRTTDVWAFGCVLYEMLSGKRVFKGDTLTEILADVIKSEPDWAQLPAKTPKAVRRLLVRCLQKEEKQRFRDLRDARLEIEEAESEPDSVPTLADTGIAAQLHATRDKRLRLGIAGTLLIAAFLGLGWWRNSRPVEHRLLRFTDDVGAEISINSYIGSAIAVSPDGLRLVYVSLDPGGIRRLSLRSLEGSKSTPLAGTEGAEGPFFFPDGKWIAFFADQKLKKISVDGGSVEILCEAAAPRGGSWASNDTIYFAPNLRGTLSRVSSSGGTPEQVTQFDKMKVEATHRFPQFVPEADALLFTASRDNNNFDAATIEVQSIQTGKRKKLADGYFGRYVPGGYLVYIRKGILMAAPMDIQRLDLIGTPSRVLEDVSGNQGGLAQFSFSANGTFAYIAGSTPLQQSLYWLEASGSLQRLPAEPDAFNAPRASSDGARIALLSSGNNIVVYDWAANRMNAVTFLKSGASTFPTWTPDGKYLFFPIDSQELSGPGIYWVLADGGSEPRRLVEGQNLATYSISNDGKHLAYFRRVPQYEISTLPLDLSGSEPKAGTAVRFHSSDRDLRVPAISPDGRWIAYVSAESGAVEVYVEPFPKGASGSGKWKVSAGAGNLPYWSSNRNELFYQTTDGRLWVVGYRAKGNSFVADSPRLWSGKAAVAVNEATLMPDGKRFLLVMPSSAAERQTHITFLLNFTDELRRRIAH